MIIHIPQPGAIPKENLEQLGAVKIPLSWPAAALTGKKYLDEIPGIDSMGIWECSPGRWRRTIMQEEFAHFISGSARFIPAEGEPIDIRAGDAIWFPANSAGVWEIHEDVRKVYVIIDRPTAWKRFKLSIKTVLLKWLGIPPRRQERPPTHPAPAGEPVAVWRTPAEQLQPR